MKHGNAVEKLCYGKDRFSLELVMALIGHKLPSLDECVLSALDFFIPL